MVKTGRFPQWYLDPENPGPVHQETVWVDKRGRLTLPGRVRNRLSWLKEGEPAVSLLILDELGRAQLLPWEPFGKKVIQRRRELLSRDQRAPEIQEALLGIANRYLKQSIEPKGRVTLSNPALVHLGIQKNLPLSIYVVCHQDRLELWSVDYRNSRPEIMSEDLSDLP